MAAEEREREYLKTEVKRLEKEIKGWDKCILAAMEAEKPEEFLARLENLRKHIVAQKEIVLQRLDGMQAKLGGTSDTMEVVRVVMDRMQHVMATTERSDQDVGSAVFDSRKTTRNAPEVSTAKLPAAPDAKDLEAFIDKLPANFRHAYEHPPAKGFAEAEDVAVLNALLCRTIAGWLRHGTLELDSGNGTEQLRDVFARELPKYWEERLQRESKAGVQATGPIAALGPSKGSAAAPLPQAASKRPASSSQSVAPLLGDVASGYLRDTHAKGLTNPSQQPDRLICAGKQVLWTSAVCFIEDKATLLKENLLNTGRGQLKKASKRVFSAQGNRAFMVGGLMSCQELELWFMYRDESAVCTGPLALSLEPTSPGLRVLFQLLSASASQLGYTPPLVPPEFDHGGVRFSAFERLTPVANNLGEELASRGFPVPTDMDFQRRTSREVFSATAAREGFPDEEVVLKFYTGAADEARTIQELENVRYAPRLLVHGDGPVGWPEFLAIAPRGIHFSVLQHDARTILTGMRDLPAALCMIVECGLLHGDVTPGNVLLVSDAAGISQLLLTDFHGAGPVGISSLPTTEIFSAVGFSGFENPEKPSLLTDLESGFYTFLHIATKEGLLWRHALQSMDAVKFKVMVRDFEKQLAVCPDELRPVFRELRELFFPDGRYREAPTPEAAVEAADQFAAICNKHLEGLKPKRGRPRGSGKRRFPPASALLALKTCLPACLPAAISTVSGAQPVVLGPQGAFRRRAVQCPQLVHAAAVAPFVLTF